MSFHIWLLAMVMLFVTSAAVAADLKTVHVHDPHIIRCKDAYYIFSTGKGIPILRSYDLKNWQPVGRVFQEDLPTWAKAKIPAATGIWAPDLFVLNGQYHLYYTVSTFGSNRSCIGLATNITLDPSDPAYAWKDQGLVIETHLTDNLNAIDAGPFKDQAGQPWMVFGSFWSGIEILKLDPVTGKPFANGAPIHLAMRPKIENNPIEAPVMTYRNGYYYLFVSFDYCGQGVNSTYKIMVGRSKNVTGPFVDAAGVPMLQGGGTCVLQTHDDIRGPGHNSILMEGDTFYLVNHYYDGRNHGIPTLMISPLTWDADGWPHVSSPIPTSLTPAPSTTKPAH